jgi:cysteine/O-acetylserine efflux protein
LYFQETMSIEFLPLLTYVLVSTFTPGPSNISSASIAVLHGYKRTLNYQGGLAVGVFLLMALSGWITTTILRSFPALESILRYVGAAYILYLAFVLLRASYTFSDQDLKPLGFAQGLVLQILNPKLIVYAFTVFSGFLVPVTNNISLVMLIAIILAAISFVSTSVWATFGTAIKTYLHNPRLKATVNILLALSLVYTAFALIGLL